MAEFVHANGTILRKEMHLFMAIRATKARHPTTRGYAGRRLRWTMSPPAFCINMTSGAARRAELVFIRQQCVPGVYV
jgi:hypothetical protein